MMVDPCRGECDECGRPNCWLVTFDVRGDYPSQPFRLCRNCLKEASGALKALRKLGYSDDE